MNKKFVLSIIVVMMLGIFSAKVVYSKTNIDKDEENRTYFLQLSTYDDESVMQEDTKNIDNKIVIKEDDRYYVYVGISGSKKNLEKVSRLYTNLGYNMYIKPRKIVNQEFLLNLEQFDKLLTDVSSLEEINTVNSVILSSYEEMVINPSNS